MSQMKFRSLEGQGHCIYKIGLGDCGKPLGLKREDMLESTANLLEMSERLGLEGILQKVYKGYVGLIWEIGIRRKQKESLEKSAKVLLMGGQQGGKSTLLGVLLSGTLDDGDGAARMHVLNHKHEVLSGQTSSMSMHLLGYGHTGQVVRHGLFGNIQSWSDIQE